MKKLTKSHIATFWRGVDAALKDLKLLDWNVQKMEEEMSLDTLATCAPQWEFRKATIRLNPVWDIEPSPMALIQIALHEVCHILLCGLVYAGEQRWMTEKEHDAQEHEIIRRLIPVMTGKEEED